MARYTGPVCRLCRREGTKLFLKGERCLTDKCPVTRRGTAPGQHGAAQVKKNREYYMQLREKQKAKRYYGVLERQFRTYFEMADKQEGQTGANLLCLLERRFDNVVYRMGLAESRNEARQLVLHAHFTINGKKADVPSIIVKKGDVIALTDKSRDSEKVKSLLELMEQKTAPKWLSLDKNKATATVVALPDRDDVDFPFQEHLIVELYSK
ncbi:MAG: 30S ribosomal protein S4 [Ruminococcus sp.]|nr:30S ribosomal protein S4 [Candidatus Apopatosoma intestinale]